MAEGSFPLPPVLPVLISSFQSPAFPFPAPSLHPGWVPRPAPHPPSPQRHKSLLDIPGQGRCAGDVTQRLPLEQGFILIQRLRLAWQLGHLPPRMDSAHPVLESLEKAMLERLPGVWRMWLCWMSPRWRRGFGAAMRGSPALPGTAGAGTAVPFPPARSRHPRWFAQGRKCQQWAPLNGTSPAALLKNPLRRAAGVEWEQEPASSSWQPAALPAPRGQRDGSAWEQGC